MFVSLVEFKYSPDCNCSYLSLSACCQCWPRGALCEEMEALQHRPRLRLSPAVAQWRRESYP